jgi:hypothetical protein
MFEDDLIVISSNGKIDKQSRIAMQQAIDKARQDLMVQEDVEIFRILDSIANAGTL